MIIAELEPSPRESGIAFLKSKRKFLPFSPSSLRVLLKIFTKLLFFLRLELFSPSPLMLIWLKLCSVIVISLYNLMASPRLSKPGPRFALVAGDRIFIFFLCLNCL